MGHDFKFVDLFAGIGGLSMPFSNIGGRCVLTSEINVDSLVTYRENAGIDDGEHLYMNDITKISLEDIPEHDLLLAGFPCQSYSIAGLRRGLDDPRGKLFLDIIRFLDHRHPKMFILENVKGLVSHDNGETFKYIISELEKYGYTIKWKVMNSMDYGNVPQNRERVYIVGFLDKATATSFSFPSPIKHTNKLADCLEQEKVDSKYYYTDRFGCFNQIKEVVVSQNTIYQWRRGYTRENKKGVCPTLTANMGTGGHNVPLILDNYGIRKLTPRECARIQGFPDTFILPKISDSKLYHQFGNSVTVTVIARLAESLIDILY